MAADNCYFEILPLEIISETFDYLQILDKKKARLVCHLWRMMVDYQKSVKFRPKLTNNKSFRHFLNSYRQMDYVVIRNVNSRLTKNSDSENEFSRITNAELGWKNSEGNIERFLMQGCEYAKSLTLAKFSLERIRRGAISKVLSEINWKNLTKFKVAVTTTKHKDTRAKKHLDNVTTLFKLARSLTIQEFEFDFDFRYGFSKKYKLRFRNLFLGLYPFVANHSKSLKILTGRINTTSQSTVEIPEIRSDLLETFFSNLKLQNCSLSLRGVRRLESLINPALFGSELKSLDLKILPCGSGLRTRWNLMARDLNLNMWHSLVVIFDRNAKSLTTVSLDMAYIPLSCLHNFSALESLNLDGFLGIGDPTDLDSLSHIRLKSFSARFRSLFQQRLFSPGLLRILRQSVGTLEHLTFFRTHYISLDEGRPIHFWIRDCTSLKSLKITHIFLEYIQQNLGVQYLHLRKLETSPTRENRRQIAAWILESMRNLEYISILGPYMDIQLLRSLLTLPKLKTIAWSIRNRRLQFIRTNDLDEMQTFCESIRGVTFTTTIWKRTTVTGRRIGHRGKTYVISVNKCGTTVVNPIYN